MKPSIYNCRVCGYKMKDAPWGIDGKSPTYEMCFCCGVEFGYQDYTYNSTIEFRKNWLSNGANWDEPKLKPCNWNLIEQMEHIPRDFQEFEEE